MLEWGIGTMQSVIDRQIHKIEDFIEKKQGELDARNYRRYKPLFDIAFAFLEKNKSKVLFYGGFALNAVLPSKLRFYGKTTLPDLDVFSYDAENLAKKLTRAFEKAQYVASFSPGIHHNTWKVMADGVQVADITHLSKEAFKRLAQKGIKVARGIKTVDREFLRMALHTVLSQPNDARLWEKTIRRLVAFYTAYPPQNNGKCLLVKTKDISKNILRYVMELARVNGFILFGMDMDRIGAGAGAPLKGMMHIIVEQNPMDVASVIKEAVGDFIIIGGPYTGEHIGNYALLLEPSSGRPWACLVQAPTCLGYKEVGGYRVATPHTMMRIYLATLLDGKEREGHFDVRSMICVSNVLSKHILSSIKTGTHVKQDFTLNCYGPFDGLYTLRKKRYVKHIAMEK